MVSHHRRRTPRGAEISADIMRLPQIFDDEYATSCRFLLGRDSEVTPSPFIAWREVIEHHFANVVTAFRMPIYDICRILISCHLWPPVAAP